MRLSIVSIIGFSAALSKTSSLTSIPI